jgi:hypothetical protein
MDRYEGMIAYICKNGHIKYAPEPLDPVICNICGTDDFDLATEEDLARVAHR